MSRIELLAPAGDLERAKIAFDYGADAVYVGGKRFSLRSRASNFELEDIREAVHYGHTLKRKLYVTVNMLPHDDDLSGLEEYLSRLASLGVDAIIVASISIAVISKRLCPQMEVHLSTQLSITNHETMRFYKNFGVDRIVLARELDIESIRQVGKSKILPIEVFIHGGMCANYSGRCTLSNEMTLRDANRGGCAQSCRWLYELYRGKDLISDPTIPFTMSSKDLLVLEQIKDLMDAGVVSLKIEGRMKSAYYIAVIVRVYRTWIDAIESGNATDHLAQELKRELAQAQGRETFDGFLSHRPDHRDHLYQTKSDGVVQNYIGSIQVVEPNGSVLVEMRNNVKVGETLEVLTPEGLSQAFVLESMVSQEGIALSVANIPLAKIWMKVPFAVKPKTFIRKKGESL